MNDTLSYQYQTQFSYEEFLEYWDSTLEKNAVDFLAKLLTDDKFATIVLDEVFQWLICYCHLFNASTIENFSKALCVKMSLDLDFADADADAGKIWHRVILTLDTEHQKLLRLVPDDAQTPDDTQKEGKKQKEKSSQQQDDDTQTPDDTQMPDDAQKEKSPQQYLKDIIEGAKDAAKDEDAAKDREIYDALFNALFSDTEKSISNYQTAASELRYALIIDTLIVDDILREDL